MDKRYDHHQHEASIYQLWQEQDVFNPDNPEQPAQRRTSAQPEKADSFCILMPPPNANDPLHIGHALFVALEDVLTRYHRMKGDDTLWLPGTDHAGIETQFVFEKKLAEKDRTRFDFDRQSLYQMIWDYVQENSEAAVNQLQRLGASADWSRFKFMLDEDMVELVKQTFLDFNEQDLVY
jgi:valyl-tRNA synthetase